MSEKNSHLQPIFSKPEEVAPREWGKEILVGLLPGQCCGKMPARYDRGDGTLAENIVNPGESVHFPTGAVHQEEALEDCAVFEISTPHFNDRVRMEEAYGLDTEGGLPSTTLEEVETK